MLTNLVATTSTGPSESNISMGLLNVRSISNKGQLTNLIFCA